MDATRTPIANMEAVAAMPGLECLAEVLVPYCRGKTDPLSLVIFNVLQWVWGGRQQTTAVLGRDGLWENVRRSAARVGRDLPVAAPTDNQLDHMRRNAKGVDIGALLAAAFAAAAVELVDAIGLLPDGTARLHHPNRANSVYSDGTVFHAQSELYVDPETGEVVGSRAGPNGRPRLAERYAGKPGNSKPVSDAVRARKAAANSMGIPASVLGVHGGERFRSVVLGVGLYFDRNEVGASLQLLDDALERYGSRIQALVYDRLLSGIHAQAVMRRGVVVHVGMRNVPNNVAGHIKIHDRSLQNALCTSATPIERAAFVALDEAVHHTPRGECTHRLYALNGALVAEPDLADPAARSQFNAAAERDAPGENPKLCYTAVEQTDLRSELQPDGTFRFLATYKVPCRRGSFRYELDLTADRITAKGTQPVADIVRPIDCTSPGSAVAGYRSDVENVNGDIKQRLPRHGRASSLSPDHFLLDLVGAVLLRNAIAWDVHVAQHTTAGKYEAALQRGAAQDELRQREVAGAKARVCGTHT